MTTGREIYQNSPRVALLTKELSLVSPDGQASYELGTCISGLQVMKRIDDIIDACGETADWAGWTVR